MNYEYAKMLEILGCLFSINVCDPKKRSVLLLLKEEELLKTMISSILLVGIPVGGKSAAGLIGSAPNTRSNQGRVHDYLLRVSIHFSLGIVPFDSTLD